MSKPVQLDLFSGIGGFSLAGHWAGFETIAFCEREPYCQRVLAKHWPGVHRFDDITTLTAELIRGVHAGPVDVVTGGFPCQNLAACGDGKGLKGDKSKLWFEYLRLIQELRPDWVVIENSPMLRLRGADIVIEGLEKEHYSAWSSVVGACDAGAPHKRERTIIVAHNNHARREEQCRTEPVPAQQFSAKCGSSSLGQAMGDINEFGRSWEPRGGAVPESSNGYARIRTDWRLEPGMVRDVHGVSSRLDRHRWPAYPKQDQFEYEPPRTGYKGKNRVARIHALGNAVVPQVMYPFLQFIYEQIMISRESEGVYP